jgi:hypothetical protein
VTSTTSSPYLRPGVGWEDLTELLPATEGWMHSGVAVEADGTIYCAHPDGHALLTLHAGEPARTLPLDFAELHGLALTGHDGVLAVADPGYRMTHVGAGRYREDFTTGRAAFIDVLDGRVVVEFAQPDIPAYAIRGWRPTDIAVAVTPSGDREVWITDGYGENLVHRFDGDGLYRGTVDGSATGLSFDCPHGILLRLVDEQLEVVVADRANHRLVRFTTDGTLLGEFGQADLDSPSSLTELDGRLFVTELHGGIAVFDSADHFEGTLETHRRRSHVEPDWPNVSGAEVSTLAAPPLPPTGFNSPHGITAHGGQLYLTEWFIGGRLVAISPL